MQSRVSIIVVVVIVVVDYMGFNVTALFHHRSIRNTLEARVRLMPQLPALRLINMICGPPSADENTDNCCLRWAAVCLPVILAIE